MIRKKRVIWSVAQLRDCHLRGNFTAKLPIYMLMTSLSHPPTLILGLGTPVGVLFMTWGRGINSLLLYFRGTFLFVK